MTKKFCKKCGSALTKEGARFCTSCGATVDEAEIESLMSQETKPLSTEQAEEKIAQTVSAAPPSTEVLPASNITPNFETELMPQIKIEVLPASNITPNFETELMPQIKITARAEKSATAVVADAPATKPQKKSQKKHKKAAPANQPLGGRKKMLMAASLGVVALAAVSIFFVISRRSTETQGAILPADNANPAASAQPLAQQSNQQYGQQSGAGASNQAQPQTAPQPGPAIAENKSHATNNTVATPTPQRQALGKPTPPPTPEKQVAAGISAETYLNQGISYLTSSRYQEALQEFEQAKRLDPGNKNVYYLIGQAYQKMNQLERALEAYRQCTSGHYASPAQNHVKILEKKVGKVSEK
jgi:uncharacterized Zn finger protein (UPF0148 family)